MRLFLARHGESTWNVEGRYQGRMDPPLSARGVLQANALAERVRADAPLGVVSSPLARARGTAEIVARSIELPLDVDPSLIEISHGEWEGLLLSEVEQRWPQMIAAWRTSPASVVFPGGESLADVHARWRSFLASVESRHSPLLVVTHDAIVRLAVLDARNEPLERFNAVSADNAALTELRVDSGNLELVAFNERSFLREHWADPAAQAL